MGPAVAGVAVLVAGLVTAAGWVDWLGVGRWLQARAGAATAVVVGGVLLVLAARRQWPRASPRASRTLSWSVVAVGGALVAAVTWGATGWLLQQAERAKDPAAARVEAVKTGLGIGAGTGGVFALLLAVRRQWHQELNAADSTHDATERRVTELYTKAADQLGSDKPAVRLAGLYALERVAQNNENQRQTVVNVLAAYLRLPFDPPGTLPGDDDIPLPAGGTADAKTNAEMDQLRREYRERIQELEVRQAAQRILAQHLQPGPTPTTPLDTFWTNIDLDLTGATLVGWSLHKCRLDNATFNRTTFTGFTTFEGAHVNGSATFDNAQFVGDAWFYRARFDGSAWFHEVQFDGDARFVKARFYSPVRFSMARFGTSAWFDQARFDDSAYFARTRFGGGASFDQAQFDGEALFAEAQFDRFTVFAGAQFNSEALFNETRFASAAAFNKTQFVDFTVFIKARFDGTATFDGAQFGSVTAFDEAQFANRVPPEIDGYVDPSTRGGANSDAKT